jgi:chaperonin GroES
MNIKPVRDFVAVVKESQQKKTSSGLYVPDVVEDKVITGTVVAVGSGHIAGSGNIIPLEIKVGDSVMFSRASAVEIKVGDSPVMLLREENIFCSFRDPER